MSATGPPPGHVLFAEAGSSYRPVLAGPVFGVLGLLGELALGGPVSAALWVGAAVVISGFALILVRAKRQFGSVSVTPEQARFGQETVAVADIAGVDDVGAAVGARVLGGGWAVPKGTDGVPVQLVDGSRALAWARDTEALRDALRGVLDRPR